MKILRLLAFGCVVLVAVVAVSAFVVGNRQNAAVVRQARAELAPQRTYTTFGPYIGPLRSNVSPPKIILDRRSRLPVVAEHGVAGYQVNPVAIEQYGLWAYGAKRQQVTLRVADWLVANQRDGRWWYRFDFAHPNGFSLGGPWSSAMAQGQGMSVLVRAYHLTGNKTYLRAALAALPPLETPLHAGGLRSCGTRDCRLPFFQEYPAANPPYVLNGFMFTLVGLHDLATVAPHSAAARLYRGGVNALVSMLPRYDFNGRASYDLTQEHGRKADLNLFYQAIDANLLAALNAISPRKTLAAFQARWSSL